MYNNNENNLAKNIVTAFALKCNIKHFKNRRFHVMTDWSGVTIIFTDPQKIEIFILGQLPIVTIEPGERKGLPDGLFSNQKSPFG
jgi:hypothetical protein